MVRQLFRSKTSRFLTTLLLGGSMVAYAGDPKEQFSKVYTFGDSFLSPADSYGQYITSRYGFPFTYRQTTFAVGGESTAGFQAEINLYKANVGAFDPHALYSVYFGPNDITGSAFDVEAYNIYVATTGVPPGPSFQQIQQDIQNGMNTFEDYFPGNDADILGRAQNYANGIQELVTGGARYIIVLNHFNEFYRQLIYFLPNEAEFFYGQWSNQFNQTIQEQIASNSPDANIIYVDYNRLVAEVSTNPSQYLTAAQMGVPNFPFFDGSSHPTSAAHVITGQYIASVVEAPTKVAIVREIPLATGEKLAWNVQNMARLHSLMPMTQKMSIEASGDYINVDTGSFTNKQLGFKNGRTINGDITVNFKPHKNLVLGAQINSAYTKSDFVKQQGKTQINDIGLTLHAIHHDDKRPYFIFGSFGAGKLDYTIDRYIQLGTANIHQRGKPTGWRYTGNVGAGYRFKITEEVNIVPVVSGRYQSVSLKSYTEKGDIRSTRMSFAIPKRESIVGEIGATVEAKYKMRHDMVLLPSLTVNYAYDFKKPIKDKLKARVSDFSRDFSMSSYNVDQSTFNVQGEVRTVIHDKYTVGINAGGKPSGRVKTWNAGLSAGVRF